AYGGLKDLIQRRFHGRKDAVMALEQHEVKPEVWEPVLRDQLAEAQAHQDSEILEAARRLLDLLNAASAAAGKYRVEFNASVRGAVMGDDAHVIQTFGPQSPDG